MQSFMIGKDGSSEYRDMQGSAMHPTRLAANDKLLAPDQPV